MIANEVSHAVADAVGSGQGRVEPDFGRAGGLVAQHDRGCPPPAPAVRWPGYRLPRLNTSRPRSGTWAHIHNISAAVADRSADRSADQTTARSAADQAAVGSVAMRAAAGVGATVPAAGPVPAG